MSLASQLLSSAVGGAVPPMKLPPDDRDVDVDASTQGPGDSSCASGCSSPAGPPEARRELAGAGPGVAPRACRLWGVADFELGQTIGTGLAGSVRLATFRGNSDAAPFAMKVMEKIGGGPVETMVAVFWPSGGLLVAAAGRGSENWYVWTPRGVRVPILSGFGLASSHRRCLNWLSSEKSKLVRRNLARHVLSERQILSAVRHPFLVELVASFQDETRLFMLMEFVDGGELKARLEQVGKLPDASARFYASELTSGLGYLHSSDIMHRDLKPENVLIDRCGHLKIADFGLAKVVHHLTWTLCGTPEYLAPEFITGKGHGKAADWWSLGILTYQMLAGTRPFVGSNVRRLYREVVESDVVFPSDMLEDARSLIDGLLTKEQSCRLGGSGRDAEDVMGHRWFGSVDWSKVIRKQCEPPFVPRVRSARDTRLFARRPAPEDQGRGCLVSEEQQALFHGFDAPADAARLVPRLRAQRSFWGRLCTGITGRGA